MGWKKTRNKPEKKIEKKPEKKIIKIIKESQPEIKKKQRLVRVDKVDQKKKEGWKEVDLKKDKHNRLLGVNTNTSDLVLMEK